MAKSVPVSRERHSGKGWRHPAGYGFVAADTIAPLGGSEFAHAAAAMPIAFIERSGHFLPVALLGLAKGSNVFVGPGGQWLGGYVPAVLRAYPFSLMRGEGSEQTFLCVDEDSGLIVDGDGETVEKFFEPDGSPSAMTNTLTDFLHSIEQDQNPDRSRGHGACRSGRHQALAIDGACRQSTGDGERPLSRRRAGARRSRRCDLS